MCLAVPSKVLSIEKNVGRVDFGGVIREVNLSLLDDVKVGDFVIIHAGYALQRIDEDEAAETLKLFQEIADLEAEERAG